MRRHSNPVHFRSLKVSAWDIFKNEENSLMVALLRGSDYTEDHCVTIWGKWIFDSNFSNALPLTQASLNLCCSADDTHDKFVSVVQALMCTNYFNLINKKTIKNEKGKIDIKNVY